MNKYEELEKLQNLRQNKAITEQEFETLKKSILNNNFSNTTYKENKKTEKVKHKMKALQIILKVVSIVLVRIYSSSTWNCNY